MIRHILMGFVCAWWGSVLWAADAQKTLQDLGRQPLLGVDRGSALIAMTLTDAQGVKRERTLRFKGRRSDDDQLQYLIKFESPSEIKGTAFLVKGRKGQLPDQRIYMPAAKVVRRIAAGNAYSAFFGSDFLYADLMPYASDKKDDFVATDLGSDKIQIIPKNAQSPYGKLILTMRKDPVMAQKIEFFDRAMKLLKTLRVKKMNKVDGKLVPTEIEMNNVQTQTKTELVVSQIDFNAKLSANDFTEEAMQR